MLSKSVEAVVAAEKNAEETLNAANKEAQEKIAAAQSECDELIKEKQAQATLVAKRMFSKNAEDIAVVNKGAAVIAEDKTAKIRCAAAEKKTNAIDKIVEIICQ